MNLMRQHVMCVCTGVDIKVRKQWICVWMDVHVSARRNYSKQLFIRMK